MRHRIKDNIPAFLLIFTTSDSYDDGFHSQPLRSQTIEDALLEAKDILKGEESDAEIDWDSGEFYWCNGEGALEYDGLESIEFAMVVPTTHPLPLGAWIEEIDQWETRMNDSWKDMDQDQREKAAAQQQLEMAKQRVASLEKRFAHLGGADPSVSTGAPSVASGPTPKKVKKKTKKRRVA